MMNGDSRIQVIRHKKLQMESLSMQGRDKQRRSDGKGQTLGLLETL